VDLSDIVADLRDLLEVAVSRKVALCYDLAGHLSATEADPSQLRQVVMNLVTNASEAIEGGGTITVRTRTLKLDEDVEGPAGPAPRGWYVCLEVADTGCGMAPDTLCRIFDPFFTTKFTGRGLGLAAVLGIVRGHRGAILVKSEPGRGTTFQVLLPCPEEAIAGRAAESARSAGTVLVIDDEEIVRSVAREALERAGFRVLTAADGTQGIRSFSERREEIALVLLDMTMPGLGGEESFQVLRSIREDVKILLSSGFSEHEAIVPFEGQGLAGFIQKPYRPDELVAKVRGVLGS
jgi:CheY-like chemotaxis protein